MSVFARVALTENPSLVIRGAAGQSMHVRIRNDSDVYVWIGAENELRKASPVDPTYRGQIVPVEPSGGVKLAPGERTNIHLFPGDSIVGCRQLNVEHAQAVPYDPLAEVSVMVFDLGAPGRGR